MADRSAQVLGSGSDVPNWCRYCDSKSAESQLHVMMECALHDRERNETLWTVAGMLAEWESKDGYRFEQLDRKEQMFVLLGRHIGMDKDLHIRLNQCVQKFLVGVMGQRQLKARTLLLLDQCQQSARSLNY